MNIALIVSGGTGARFNDTVPKQYHSIDGRQVISFVIDAARKAKSIDKLIIVSHEEYKDLICKTYNAEWAEGGADRNSSIKNGLDYIKKNYDCKKLIILDAVRPLIKSELLDRYMELLDDHPAVATAQKITDSLGCYDMQEVNRERYYLLSSPEAFDFNLLYSYMDPKSPLTEVTQQLPIGTGVYLYFEYFNNLKITYKTDLRLAQIMLQDEGL